MTDTAKGAFAGAMGDSMGAVQDYQQALGDFASAAGLSPVEQGQFVNQNNNLINDLVKAAVEGRNVVDANGTKHSSGSAGARSGAAGATAGAAVGTAQVDATPAAANDRSVSTAPTDTSGDSFLVAFVKALGASMDSKMNQMKISKDIEGDSGR